MADEKVRILVSRVDNIGDVILTLPLCGWIKQNIPDSEVHFLCKELTKEIVKKSSFVDEIHVWPGKLPYVDAIIHVFPKKDVAKTAKKSRIKTRIGTSHRLFHLTTCNKRINFSRIKSDLHEAQLNFKLLKGLGFDVIPELTELSQLVSWKKSDGAFDFIENKKFNLVVHMKSRGSAKEWHSDNYFDVISKLPTGQFNIILTGTKEEGDLIKNEVPKILDLPNVKDTTGKLSLTDLMSVIESSDGLLACSTGPLHIAALAGIRCLGLYPAKRPMHAGRWGPIGEKAEFLTEKEISENKYLNIKPSEVVEVLTNWVS